ncbi:unnamed protein product [Chrysoparadoxa australica]
MLGCFSRALALGSFRPVSIPVRTATKKVCLFDLSPAFPQPLLAPSVPPSASDYFTCVLRAPCMHQCPPAACFSQSAGSAKNGRNSRGRRLGVKKFGGEKVIAGNIIIRQRGTKYHQGDHVGIGRDHTLFSKVDGHVLFEWNPRKKRQIVHVKPLPDYDVNEKKIWGGWKRALISAKMKMVGHPPP